jgi:hypothetical protein
MRAGEITDYGVRRPRARPALDILTRDDAPPQAGMKICPQKLRLGDPVRSVVPARGFVATLVPMVVARRSAPIQT